MRNRLIDRVVRGIKIEPLGMAMPGVMLTQRIRRMLSGIPTPKISRSRMACTLAVCAISAATLAVGTLVHAQSKSQTGFAFEVASVRPSNPSLANRQSKEGGGGGAGVSYQVDHKKFSSNLSLFGLIVRAYGVKGCGPVGNVSCVQLAGGPDWLKKDGFDIQAKMPDATPDYTTSQFSRGEASQLQLMLQALLADRFGLRLHRERKQLPVFALTIDKKGVKFKKPDATITGVGWLLKPVEPGGERTLQLMVGKRSMQDFADSLSAVVGRPVLDRTGLKGNVEFTVEYPADVETPGVRPDVAGPAMFTALQEQAGVKLEATKGPVEILVIDHAEKPSEN